MVAGAVGIAVFLGAQQARVDPVGVLGDIRQPARFAEFRRHTGRGEHRRHPVDIFLRQPFGHAP